MRQTKKYLQAYETLATLRKKPRKSMSNDDCYKLLESEGYLWDSKKGLWEKGSKSVFTTPESAPSGVVKIRIMAHPQDVDKALDLIRKTQGLRVIEASDHYENRKGAGVRIYTDVILL